MDSFDMSLTETGCVSFISADDDKYEAFKEATVGYQHLFVHQKCRKLQLFTDNGTMTS